MAKNSKNDEKAGNAAERAARKAANQAERAARKAERQQARAQKKQKPEKAQAAADRPRKDKAGKPKAGKVKNDETGAAAEKKAAPRAERAAKKSPHDETRKGIAEPEKSPLYPDFNILIVAQAGKLAQQAALFTASLRRFSPDWRGRLIVAEPQPDGAWSGRQTRLPETVRDFLTRLGAEVLPFTAQHFGRAYPYGNKIEALPLLPEGQPFIFFDTDTLITGPLDRLPIDFSRPSASMRREGTWPVPPLYGPGFGDIWRSLYDRFGLDFESSLDRSQPDEHWERYLYFNAGWFLGADPKVFHDRFLSYALAVRDEPGDALASQSLDPWLDQVVLPLVIHGLGGGRPGPELDGLDGAVTCHYRNLALLYARESDATIAAFEDIAALPEISDLLREDPAFDKLVRQGAGRDEARQLFAGRPLPQKEQAIRQALRKANLWFDK